jgi:thiamine transport system substrate-binding protein
MKLQNPFVSSDLETAVCLAALSVASSLVLTSAAEAQDQLTIYTYESFTADWGPGPVVEEAFEDECGCDLRFVSVADGVALLNRIRLEGSGTRADIVLGLDNNLLHEAKSTGLFAPHGTDTSRIKIPGDFSDDVFVPYDYSYFAFVYDKEAMDIPPASLAALVDADSDLKIVIQDPRTSTPGLGLLLWMKAVYGDESASAWEKLQDKVLTVTPGWSEAYGLFTNGEAPMVLSYTTSPAYHLIEEDSERYAAAAFSDGHYLQIEVAAQTARGAENHLARQFLEFMQGPGFQDVIAQTNWMFPAGEISKPLHPAFDTLVKPSKTLLIPPQDVAEQRADWINEWLSVMSR